MPVLNRLGVILGVAALLSATVFLEARTRKGDRYLKDGRAAEVRREYDKALELFEKAVAEDPFDSGYQLALRRVRFQAGQAHVHNGQKLRVEGKLEEALAEFQKAYAIDPGSSIAEQELRRTYGMIEREKQRPPEGEPQAAVPPEQRGLTPSEEAERKSLERASTLLPVPELRPISRHITTLKMNNQPVKVLFETIGKLAGVNVLFDPEYQPPPRNSFSVELSRTTLEEALEHLCVLTKSYWKPLSATTIFVTNDNVTKRRDYEDLVVKVFYIKNITTVQELQEIHTAVRSIVNIRLMFTYNALNAIIARGTVDQIALAEKLIHDLDKPKPEVVVDVIVMEANRTRTRDLAATLASAGQAGLQLPISFTPRGELALPKQATATTDDGTGLTSGLTSLSSAATASAIRLSSLGRISTGDYSMTLPGALLTALMSDRQTKVLQSPQLRTADGQKASLKIGDKFPYATGSFQPGIGAVGVSPLVSTQFQFADVGVNVDITPKIHGADEVSMHVEIEISNVRDRIDVGGLSQPVIGSRRLIHSIRMKKGETTLLGGLMQDTDTRTQTGVPGLGNLPIIRRLFSSETKERNESELLIALVPHIVRAPEITELNIRGVAAGTDQVLKLTYGARGDTSPPPPESKPMEEPPAAAPAPAPEEAPKPEAEAPAPPAPEPAVGARMVFMPAAVQAKAGETVSVSLNLENVTDVFNTPMRLKFNQQLLRLEEVTVGGLMTGDGQQPIFARNILNDVGEASVLLNRLPGSSGVSGSGALLVLTFTALGPGTAEVGMSELTVRNSQMQSIDVGSPVLSVVIQ